LLLQCRDVTNLLASSASVLSDGINEAFPHSRADTRRALAGSAGVRRLGPGEMIIRQGDASAIAPVLEGHIAVRRTTMDGRQFMVRLVTPGRLSPVLPLAARPASADAVALTPSVAAVWRSEDFRALLMADPGLAIDTLDDVLGSLEEVMGRLDGLLYQNALRRVARVLFVHADLFFADPPVLTRAHLPTLVGTSREMTGRVLRVLESRRVVARTGRDRLRLLDPSGLAAVAESGPDEPRPAPGTSSSSRVAGRSTIRDHDAGGDRRRRRARR
jgi:CRP-like cAMP-binding protein